MPRTPCVVGDMDQVEVQVAYRRVATQPTLRILGITVGARKEDCGSMAFIL